MAQPILMPKMGQSVEDCAIVKWRKTEGDVVKKGDILFEIETEKAVLEVESFYAGTLIKVIVPVGQPVPTGTTVAFVGQPGEPIPAVSAPAPAAIPATAAPATPLAAPAPVAVAPARPASSAPAATPVAPAFVPPPAAAATPTRLTISPRARALAEHSAIRADAIPGTGPNGRIVERDVQAYLDAHHYAERRISPAAKTLAIRERIDILTVRGTGDSGRIMTHDVERVMRERPRPMTKIRQVIAQRLTQSVLTAPHFFVTVESDMTDLLALRKTLKQQGKGYSVTDFVLEAVVLALQEFPVVNSSTDGKTTTWHSAVHLGMATSVEEGLLVPVIRHADLLGLAELHTAAAALAVKARDGKLLPDEMSGSTFTVSNMGMLNVENFTAIINPGEAAILAVASTLEKPVARKGRIEIRSVMKITLSADHRLIDGALAAKFINAIKNKLEDVELWKSLTLS
jgi:pyruvate dehydrogenase E2 component (dihydrolipoamide acetyltransferase)